MPLSLKFEFPKCSKVFQNNAIPKRWKFKFSGGPDDKPLK